MGEGSPSPAERTRVPVSTPGGILTSTRACSRTAPAPPQAGHFSGMTWPEPWQWWQVRAMEKKPWVSRSSPEPPQTGQALGAVPGLAPLPRQGSQRRVLGISSSFSTPKAASSSESSRW